MNELIILKDYRGAFYSSTTNARIFCSMNLERLSAHFVEKGLKVDVIEFPDIDFRQDWSGRIILYQSAEDSGLEYKSYIEDIILGLTLAGANVIPEYKFLRAHENKAFLEILRSTSRIPEVCTLKTRVYGTYEDFFKREDSYPVVLKMADTRGSRGVSLLHNRQEAITNLSRLTQPKLNDVFIKEIAKRFIRKNYIPYSLRTHKFIFQEYIPNLSHDYKVLIYGKRAFVLQRKVRKNDFRASGSGMFMWPRTLPIGLLDFAWKILVGFDVPYISLDIALLGNTFHLIEAQFVDFGPLTAEKSNFHWQRQEDHWALMEGGVELENVLAEGVTEYIQNKGWIAQPENVA
jgi:hypothetical protein